MKSYLNMVNKAAAKSTNPQRSAARPAPAPVPNLPGKKRAQERTPYPNRNRNPLPAPGERHPVLGVNLGNGMYMPGQRPTHYYYQASYQERAENVIREKVVHKVCIPGGTYVDYGSPEHKKAVIMTSTALGTSLVLGYLGSTGILAKAGETASSKLMPVVDKAGAKLGSLIGESSELTLAGGGSIKVPVSGNIKNMLLQMKVQNEVQKVVKESWKKVKGTNSNEKVITNSAGENVIRRYVKNQDELLQKAEEAAGGNLDDFEEIKPGWYKNREGTVKIEWNPEGHANTNEGPHVTVRSRNARGGWNVIAKYFIEGRDYYR